jgi:hypothetical protein
MWEDTRYCWQGDGGLHFVQAMQTFDDAKVRESELDDVWAYGRASTLLTMKKRGSEYSLAQGTRARTY